MEAKGLWLADPRLLAWLAWRFRITEKRGPDFRVLREEMNEAMHLGCTPVLCERGIEWKTTDAKQLTVPMLHEEFMRRFPRKY